jgi:hypothetical protein
MRGARVRRKRPSPSTHHPDEPFFRPCRRPDASRMLGRAVMDE